MANLDPLGKEVHLVKVVPQDKQVHRVPQENVAQMVLLVSKDLEVNLELLDPQEHLDKLVHVESVGLQVLQEVQANPANQVLQGKEVHKEKGVQLGHLVSQVHRVNKD